MTESTVADALAWSALPEEQQAVFRRAMMDEIYDEALQDARVEVEERDGGDIMVLNRFIPRTHYGFPGKEETHAGLYVDVETTGLNAREDKIIQLAVLPFTFTSSGTVCKAGKCSVYLEDPGVPIPGDIEKLTGITDDDVRGKRIDDTAVMALAAEAKLVVAHHAEFDRAFLDQRLPTFRMLRWGCSMADVPWTDAGYTSKKLEWLAYQHCKMFYDAHRADMDCLMGLHLLTTTAHRNRTALDFVLEAARKTYVRIYALRAPFAVKDMLKQRGYKWSDGSDGRPKAWYIDVENTAQPEECRWLASEIECTPSVFPYDAKARFSERIGRN